MGKTSGRRWTIIALEVGIGILMIMAFVRYLTPEQGESITDSVSAFSAGDYYDRAILRQDQGDYEAAVEDFTRALEAGYAPAELAYFGRGYSYWNLQRYDESIADYSMAISLDPECNRQCHFDYNNRGVVYERLERYEDALDDYAMALAYAPDYLLARRNRAYLYTYLGQPEAALSDWDHLLRLMMTDTIQRGIEDAGGTRNVFIEDAGQQMVFDFRAVAGTQVSIRLAETRTSFVVILRDADDRPVAYADTRTDGQYALEASLPVDGTYRIVVAPVREDETGEGVLNLHVQSPDIMGLPQDVISPATANNINGARVLEDLGDGPATFLPGAGQLIRWRERRLFAFDLPASPTTPGRLIAEEVDALPPMIASPDGRYLVVRDANEALVYDLAEGDLVASLREHSAALMALAFTPSADVLITLDFEGNAIAWDTVRWSFIRQWSVGGNPGALAIGADGRRVFTAGRAGEIAVWSYFTGRRSIERTASLEGDVRALAASSNRLYVAAALVTGDILVLDASSLDVLVRLTGHEGQVNALAFSPDGYMLASGGFDRTVRLWDVRGLADMPVLEGHNGYIQALAWRPDGRGLYSTGVDGTLWLWSLDD